MKKTYKLSREFSDNEINEIIAGMFDFLHEKPDHLFVDDYLILEKKLLHSDVMALVQKNEIFAEAHANAKMIETTKLKKYAAADRLNASFVRGILPPEKLV